MTMDRSELVKLCIAVKKSSSGDPHTKTFFRALHAGLMNDWPMTPPQDDPAAIRGYEVGRELRSRNL